MLYLTLRTKEDAIVFANALIKVSHDESIDRIIVLGWDCLRKPKADEAAPKGHFSEIFRYFVDEICKDIAAFESLFSFENLVIHDESTYKSICKLVKYNKIYEFWTSIFPIHSSRKNCELISISIPTNCDYELFRDALRATNALKNIVIGNNFSTPMECDSWLHTDENDKQQTEILRAIYEAIDYNWSLQSVTIPIVDVKEGKLFGPQVVELYEHDKNGDPHISSIISKTFPRITRIVEKMS